MTDIYQCIRCGHLIVAPKGLPFVRCGDCRADDGDIGMHLASIKDKLVKAGVIEQPRRSMREIFLSFVDPIERLAK